MSTTPILDTGPEGPVRLPDCRRVTEEIADEDLISLLPRQDLVRALAEKGLSGAQELLRTQADSSEDLARRIAALRERFRRQASRQVSHIADGYRRREEDLATFRTRQRDLLRSEIERLRASLGRIGQLSAPALAADPSLLEAVQQALLLPSETLREAFRPPRTTLWDRIRAFFRRLLAAIRRLLGRRDRAGPAPRRSAAEGRPLTLGVLSDVGRTLSPDTAAELFSSLTPAQMAALQEASRERLQGTSKSLSEKERDVEADFQRRQRALRQEREAAEERARQTLERESREAVSQKLTSELRERGYVQPRGSELAVTYSLVEKFARLVLEEEARALPEGLRLSLRGAASTGLYEKTRLREPDEVARLDIPSSLLASRLRGSRHILEEASYVFREVRSESLHAVLLLDVSGSMAEDEKLAAAKKALLALYTAIRRRYPDAVVDIATFDNEVRVRDLVELWEASPGAFTNTGAALQVAFDLLRSSRASRKELYLVTDGLPECYTDSQGVVRSGNLAKAMESALRSAQELRTVSPLETTLVLLKSQNPAYETAAREIAQVLHGTVVITDPGRLAFQLLLRFTGSSVVEKRPPAETASPPAGGIPSWAPGPARNARERRRERRARGRATPG